MQIPTRKYQGKLTGIADTGWFGGRNWAHDMLLLLAIIFLLIAIL